MKPSVIHDPNSGSDINNYSDPNANINPDTQQSHQPQQQPQPQQQHPHAQPQQQQQPQGIYDTNGLAGGANSRRFPFYPTGFDFFDDDDLFSDGGVRSRMNRIRDPFGTWGRKRRNSQEHIQPQQTAQTGGIPQAAPQTQQIPPPDEGYEDDFFPQMQPGWGADSTWGRQANRKRNPHLDDDDDFFSYIPQQFRQYIPSNFQLPRMRSHFGRQPVPQPATNSPQNRNFFPPQQSPPQQQQQQQQPMHPEPMNRPKYCDAAMQTDAELLAQSQANGEQPNLNQHGLRNTIDMGQKTNDEADEAGPRARSAPPDPNYDPNNPNNFASAQSFSSAPGFPGQKPHVYAQATATPGAHAQAHAQAHTANMGTNTGPGTPNGGNFHRQYYYPFDNNAPPPSSPPRQPQQQQQAPSQPQTPNQDGQFIRTVPIVIESRKVPAKPKPQPQQQTPPQAPPQPQPQQQQQPRQNSQPREIPIRVEHATTQKQAPPSPAAQAPSSPQPADPEQSKTPAPHDPITKIQAIQKEVMELMLAVEQFKGIGRDKDYMYLDEMLTRNLIKLDDIETDGKENIRLARKEAIKCIQASLCVLEMKADGRIPVNESKSDDTVNKPNETQTAAQEIKSPEDTATIEINQEKTENVGAKKDEADKTITDKSEAKTDSKAVPSPPTPLETNEINTVENKENEPENKVATATKEEVVPESTASDETNKPAVLVVAEPEADGKPAEST